MSETLKLRYTIAAGATAVVIGASFTALGLHRHASDATSARVADSYVGTAVADNTGTAPAQPPATTKAAPLSAPAGPTSTAPSASAGTSPSATPTAQPRPSASTAVAANPKVKRTAAELKAATVPAPQTSDEVLDQVLAHINAARADQGLPAYTLDTSLSKASALHNQRMINGCGMKHQCSGESSIGPRFSAQGVSWSSAGENIGFGSSGASNAEIVKAANGLTDSMLAEVPPEDGHRRNLLSKDFRRIGLSVVRDGKGLTWVTQDFVG
ncbi:CAP domain-containing protein [Krasilnikovia sp. MM14-A1259]|uniref:CAP domain-containing protein n=1 Tax=Krasilnikovia sp. MM14-A1259 TaxID=3373539 RepID=UPI00399CD791